MSYRCSIKDAMKVAEKKAGTHNWQGYQWEATTGGHLVTGEVPDGVYSRGKRKGQPRFGTPGCTARQRVVVTDEELQIVAAAYEADTGACWECKGSGKTWAGWSAAEGVRYRACSRCGATGKTPNVADQPPP